jgi:hypothetical protein
MPVRLPLFPRMQPLRCRLSDHRRIREHVFIFAAAR